MIARAFSCLEHVVVFLGLALVATSVCLGELLLKRSSTDVVGLEFVTQPNVRSKIECVARCAKYNGGGACTASRFDRQTRTCQIKASPHAQGNNVWLASDQTWDTFAVAMNDIVYTCPTTLGWYANGKYCYFFSFDVARATWADALTLCQGMGASLVWLESVVEFRYVNDTIQNKGFLSNKFWIGGRRDAISGLMQWINGETFDVNVQPWFQDMLGDCMHIEDNFVRTLGCGDIKYYVCKKQASIS